MTEHTPAPAVAADRGGKERSEAMSRQESSTSYEAGLEQMAAYVKQIEIWVGAMKVQLSVLRGIRLLEEDERRGGRRGKRTTPQENLNGA
jgi:hypothetical protein